ncbi:MAG TPA: VTT domain-containing protein [Myxococcota bacterium]|jgi:uncharacterized membrane protein YdjX (TVP38/TMEM64 family)
MIGRKRLALAIGVLAALLVAWQSGVFAWVTHENIHRLLGESGVWGPVLYVLAFALLEPFGVPGAVFVLPASLAWPADFAIAMSVLGATGGSATSYVLARGVLGDAFEQRLPPRLRAFTATAREHPLRTVIAVRVLFGLAAPAHWALALSGVRFGSLMVGSVIGFIPPMTVFVVFGRALIDWLERQQSGWIWPVALGLAIAGYVAYRWWFRRTPRRLREPSASHGSAEPER